MNSDLPMINLNMIERTWRLSNYLSIGMLYLKDNVLLRTPLKKDDFKEKIFGHWGTCPGVNAIYMHLTDFSIRHNLDIDLVIGTGHSAPALLASMFLDGTLERYYPEFSRDEVGVFRLFNAYASLDGFSSEITMNYPGNIYAGGELGGSLSFSQGVVFRNPKKFVACIIGDGEFETSLSQASWQGYKFIKKGRDGVLLPIINLNGNKMGSKSLLSEKTNNEIDNYFSFHHLIPVYADTNHLCIAKAFERCYNVMYDKNDVWPVLILRTPKGWTAPNLMGGQEFAGSFNSHKPLLTSPHYFEDQLVEVQNWLYSYNPGCCFNQEGVLNKSVLDYFSALKKKIGDNIIEINHSRKVLSHQWTKKHPVSCKSSVEMCSEYLCNLIESGEELMIFSPDELKSNGFLTIIGKENAIEILNEHMCFSWAHGHVIAGGKSLFITYEAFAPLVDSLVDQYLKTIESYEVRKRSIRHNSINIILTSLGWNNVPSHHNPSFVDGLLGKENVNIFFPITPEDSVLTLQECFETNNGLNIIVMHKRNLRHLDNIAVERCEDFCILKDAITCEPYMLVIVIGDIIAEETIKAIGLMEIQYASKIKVIAIERINVIKGLNTSCNHVLKELIYNSFHVCWIYNGSIFAFSSLLWSIGLSPSLCSIMGFSGKATKPSGLERMKENGINSHSLAAKFVEIVKENYYV